MPRQHLANEQIRPRGARYITLNELRSKLGRRSRSAIYVDIAKGRLPAPIRLGGRIYWREDDIDAHLESLRGWVEP